MGDQLLELRPPFNWDLVMAAQGLAPRERALVFALGGRKMSHARREAAEAAINGVVSEVENLLLSSVAFKLSHEAFGPLHDRVLACGDTDAWYEDDEEENERISIERGFAEEGAEDGYLALQELCKVAMLKSRSILGGYTKRPTLKLLEQIIDDAEGNGELFIDAPGACADRAMNSIAAFANDLLDRRITERAYDKRTAVIDLLAMSIAIRACCTTVVAAMDEVLRFALPLRLNHPWFQNGQDLAAMLRIRAGVHCFPPRGMDGPL